MAKESGAILFSRKSSVDSSITTCRLCGKKFKKPLPESLIYLDCFGLHPVGRGYECPSCGKVQYFDLDGNEVDRKTLECK